MTPEQQALRELMPVVAMLENAGRALADREPVLFAEALKEAFDRDRASPFLGCDLVRYADPKSDRELLAVGSDCEQGSRGDPARVHEGPPRTRIALESSKPMGAEVCSWAIRRT